VITKPKFKAKKSDLDADQVEILETIGESFTPLLKSMRADNSQPTDTISGDDNKSLQERIEDALKVEKEAAEAGETMERLVGQWLLTMLEKQKLNGKDELSKCLRAYARKEIATRAIEYQRQM